MTVLHEPDVVEEPTELPVTLDDLKEDLRVESDEHDASLQRLLNDAISWAQRKLQRSLMTQTRELAMDQFPADVTFTIPYGPVQEVLSVEYDSAAGTSAIPPTDYTVNGDDITAPNGWPTDASFVSIIFVAGYDSADKVPGAIKRAIVLKVQERFDGVDNTKTIDNELVQYWRPVA